MPFSRRDSQAVGFQWKANRGYILISSMSFAVLVMLIGVGAIFLSLMNISVAKNILTNSEVKYRAEAAIDAAIAFIQQQTSERVLTESTLNSELIAQLNSLSLSPIASSCAERTPSPTCVSLSASIIGGSDSPAIRLVATSRDSQRNAEYVASASVRLTREFQPYEPDYAVIAGGTISSEVPDVLLQLSDNRDLGDLSTPQLYSSHAAPELLEIPKNCKAESTLQTCKSGESLPAFITPLDLYQSIFDLSEFPSQFEQRNVTRNTLAGECWGGRKLEYLEQVIHNQSLGDCVLVTGDIVLSGNSQLHGTTIVANGTIIVDGAVSFTGSSSLIADDLATETVGISLRSSNISAHNLLLVSSRGVEIDVGNQNLNSVFIFSGGDTWLNSFRDFSGFIYALGNVHINGSRLTKSGAIGELINNGVSLKFAGASRS